MNLFNKKDFKKFIDIVVTEEEIVRNINEEFSFLTELKNKASYLELAKFYFNDGIIKNNDLAFEYFNLAKDHNIIEAYSYLGCMYIFNTVPKYSINNVETGKKYLEFAMNKNIVSAFYFMAIYHINNKEYDKVIELLKKVSSLNDPLGDVYLSVMYSSGLGVTKNIDKGYQHLNKVLACNDAKVFYELGNIYEYGTIVKEDLALAFNYYMKGAQLNDANSLGKVGTMYEFGLGCAKDLNKAKEFYKKAAQLNSCDGCYNYAMNYKGKDEKLAFIYFYRGACLGHKESMVELGIFYEKGNFVKKDIFEAVKWYKKAPKELYDLYNDNEIFYQVGLKYENGVEVERDLNEAFELLYLAAKYGNEDAKKIIPSIKLLPKKNCFLIYKMEQDKKYMNPDELIHEGAKYWSGKGAELNKQHALNYFYAATLSGKSYTYRYYADALVSLGDAKNKQVAIKYLVKAFELGDNDASASLISLLFELGEYEKAHQYIQRGIVLGDANSYRYLAIAYENGYGVKRNLKEAFNYYKEAAVKGNRFALTKYADFCLEGYGKKEDIEKALTILQKEGANKNGATSILMAKLYVELGEYNLAYRQLIGIVYMPANLYEEKENLLKIIKKKLKIK